MSNWLLMALGLSFGQAALFIWRAAEDLRACTEQCPASNTWTALAFTVIFFCITVHIYRHRPTPPATSAPAYSRTDLPIRD